MAYYRTQAGKIKKRLQNNNRRKSEPQTEKNSEAMMSQEPREVLTGDGFEPGMVSYLRMVTGLIEGRRVSREEILEMLTRAVRQHSMEACRDLDYRMWHLDREPP